MAPDLLDALRGAVRAADTRSVALSGGLDSASLLALAAEDGPATAWVLRVGPPDEERAHAEEAIAWTGADARYVDVDEADLPAAFPDAVRAMRTPVVNGLAVAKLLFWRAVTAPRALSGVGADEVLLGNPDAVAVRDGVAAFERAHRAERALLHAVLRPEARTPPPDPPPLCGLADAAARFRDTVLVELTAPAEVRTAAAAGVEVRLPFLDPRLEPFRGLTVAELVRDGLGKSPLREAMRGRLPDAIRLRPKRGRLVDGAGDAWAALYEDLLGRAGAVDGIDVGAARALAGRLPRLVGEDRAVADRVLLRLCTAIVLATEP